jgi:hypothetical protein
MWHQQEWIQNFDSHVTRLKDKVGQKLIKKEKRKKRGI